MTTKPRIIQVGSLAGSLRQPDLGRPLRRRRTLEIPRPQGGLAEHGKGITAIVTSANFGANAELINALPDLKAICSWGVGYETIDVAAAQARGVQVSNTPDVLTDCVADLAWGLLIAAARAWARANASCAAAVGPDSRQHSAGHARQRQEAGHRRPGPHRRRHRQARRGLRHAGALSQPQEARRRGIRLRSLAGRTGALGRFPDRGHGGRRGRAIW